LNEEIQIATEEVIACWHIRILLILNISETHDCFQVLRPTRPMILLDSQL